MKASKMLGFTWQDKQIYSINLENEQMQVSLTNLGATLTSVFMPGRDGSRSKSGFKLRLVGGLPGR